MPEEFSDLELVSKCKNGDESAFDALVRRHQDAIFNLVHRHIGNYEDAADVTQEVFVRAYRGIHSFKGHAAFGTWLYRIAVNTALSFRRKQRTHKPHVSFSANGENDDKASFWNEPVDFRQPAHALSRRERQQMVLDAIRSLDEQYRVVIILKDIEGCDYGTIAQILGCPKGTVKSRIHRGRLQLRSKLAHLVGKPEKGKRK